VHFPAVVTSDLGVETSVGTVLEVPDRFGAGTIIPNWKKENMFGMTGRRDILYCSAA